MCWKRFPQIVLYLLRERSSRDWIGRGLYGFQSEARFMDIGTPEAYASAQSFFATGLAR